MAGRRCPVQGRSPAGIATGRLPVRRAARIPSVTGGCPVGGPAIRNAAYPSDGLQTPRQGKIARRVRRNACRHAREVCRVSQPVVHFEVIGKDPARLRKYFGELFGWEFDVPSPVAREVSEPDSYGFLDLVTSEDGTGIRGGVGGGPGYGSHAVFYVGVPDVEVALQRAEGLGGTRVMGPATSPNGLVIGHFTDPEGTLIGVAGVA